MITRRKFQHLGVLALPFVYVAGFATAAVRFLSPLPRKPRQDRIDAGAVDEFAPSKPAKSIEFNGRLVYIFHDGTTIRAFDALCPHLGCNVLPPEKKGFNCTCHGARFDLAGRALPGGPTRESLTELAIDDLASGRVVILDQPKRAS